jgi:hypothetical protein
VSLLSATVRTRPRSPIAFHLPSPGRWAQPHGTPGPVFIHAEVCRAYDGEGFPEELRSVSLAFEARAKGSRVTDLSARDDVSADVQIKVLFEEHGAQWLHVRHAEAGCYVARVDRLD